MSENTKEVKALTSVENAKGYEINIPMGPILSMDKSILPEGQVYEVSEEEVEFTLGDPLMNQPFDIDKVVNGILSNNSAVNEVSKTINGEIENNKKRKQEEVKAMEADKEDKNTQDKPDIKGSTIEDIEFE